MKTAEFEVRACELDVDKAQLELDKALDSLRLARVRRHWITYGKHDCLFSKGHNECLGETTTRK